MIMDNAIDKQWLGVFFETLEGREMTQKKPTWRTYLIYASILLIGVGFVFFLFEMLSLNGTGFQTKTLWDWMELLIIPFVLAGGAFYLNRSERTVERQIAENRAKEDRQIAEDRAKLEREIATDRQQEAALQAYLDKMTELLLEKKLRSARNKEVRNVARIRTLTVLQVLNQKRKEHVLHFLYEAGLIKGNNPIVNLSGADFGAIDLVSANLTDVNLSEVNLSDSNLNGACLENAILNRADLCGSWMGEVNLRNARLLETALEEVHFEEADLQGANLHGASLFMAILTDSNMRGADLSGADLLKAQVSLEQLATAKSLKDVRMPDGTGNQNI